MTPNRSTNRRSYTYKTQAGLVRAAQRHSYRIFAPEENHTSTYIPEDSDYIYFPGISYFESATITPDMLTRLQKGATLLSVGVGDGHLERLLTDGFGVPKGNITLSDRKIDPNLKHKGFKTVQFDMTKSWPYAREQFDYVLFPESLGVATMSYDMDEEQMAFRFRDVTDKVVEETLEGRQHKNEEFFLKIMEADVPRVQRIYPIIKEALHATKPQGEVRIRFGLNEKQHRAYVIARLRKEFPDIAFPHSNYWTNFFVKKPER